MNKYLEKIAKSREERKRFHDPYLASKSAIGGALAGLGATAVLSPLANIPLQRELKDSGRKYGISNQTIKAFNKRHGLNVQHAAPMDNLFHSGGPAIAPAHEAGSKPTANPFTAKKWKDFVMYGKHDTYNNGIWMHELGHAKDLSENTGTKLRTLSLGRLAGGVLPTMALGAVLGSHEKTEDYAPAAALLSLPALHAEHRANMAAYQHLKDVKGAKTAGRFLKGIAPKNMLSYAAVGLTPGIVSGLAAKAIARNKREAEAAPLPKLKSK